MSRHQDILYEDSADGFSEINHHGRRGGPSDYSFGDGTQRYRLKKDGFWRPDAEFSFFRTWLEPKAVELLKDAPRQSRLDGFRSMHLTVLHELLTKDSVPHIYYEAVEKTGRGGGWPHWDAPLWPAIHCLRVVEMKQSLQDYIDEIHGPRGEELMEKHDAPQYYCRDYRKRLNPSVLDRMAGGGSNLLRLDQSRSLRLSGRQLRDVVDFLIPLEYSESRSSGGFYDD